jgi:hypothetical protein
VTIKGGPVTQEVKVLPKHKKNPAIGEKTTVYTSSVFVEQDDAASFGDQEEASPNAFFGLEYQLSRIHIDHSHGLGQCHCAV